MSLSKYNKKRNFNVTSEPEGKVDNSAASRFVIQRHDASRLHYDFRLEMGGTLKSWAVPKGPSLNPADKRLAVMVEDHPVSYIDFKGTIPEGNYGAGKVIIWDKGHFLPIDKDHNAITEKQALAAIKKGELKIFMNGRKIKGEFVLVQLKKAGEDGKNWLLIKHNDDYAVSKPYDSEDFVAASHKKKPVKKAAAKKSAAPRKKAAPKT